jgi:mono/diheme cytochrome c family protein
MRAVALVALALVPTACSHASDGAKVFRAECGGCHSLTGREHGAMGGDLAIPTLSVADIESFALQMPTPRPLSHEEARAVAAYVHRKELVRIRSGGNG